MLDESPGHCGVTEFANGYQTVSDVCCLDQGSIKDAGLSPALAGIPKHRRQFSAVLRSNATLVAERTPLFVAWCKEQCRHKCERCRFVSASLLNRECSWYAACRPEQLVRFEDFHSYAVPSTVPLKSHEACEAAQGRTLPEHLDDRVGDAALLTPGAPVRPRPSLAPRTIAGLLAQERSSSPSPSPDCSPSPQERLVRGRGCSWRWHVDGL